MTTQKRGLKIAMTDAERDSFLDEERVVRVATVGKSGPHATPLWFVWDGTSIWLHSLTRSQRWADIVANPRIAAVVDAGHDYLELRGVEISGDAEVIGDTPRLGEPNETLKVPESLFATKYMGLDEMFYDGKHGWLRITPTSIRSWDFRKL
jgi:hypothetical protein